MGTYGQVRHSEQQDAHLPNEAGGLQQWLSVRKGSIIATTGGWTSVFWRQGGVSCGRQNFPHPHAPKWKTPCFTIVDLITLYMCVLFDWAILPTGKFLSDKLTFLEKIYIYLYICTYIFYTHTYIHTHSVIFTEAVLVITRDRKQVNIHQRNMCSHYINPTLDV